MENTVRIPSVIEKFKAQVPILNQVEMSVTEKGNEIRYAWQNLSFMGQPNWVSFYVDRGCDQLKQVVICIGLSKNDEVKRTESAVLVYKMIQVICGYTISISDFMQWINVLVQEEGGKRLFGDILVKYLVAEAQAGFVTLLVIER